MMWFRFVDGMPCDATFDNIIEKVWNQEHWVKCIFDKAQSGIRKYNVEAMFLQLIAAKLIGIVLKGDKTQWQISRKDTDFGMPQYCYDDPTYWDGVYLEPDANPRQYKLAEIRFN